MWRLIVALPMLAALSAGGAATVAPRAVEHAAPLRAAPALASVDGEVVALMATSWSLPGERSDPLAPYRTPVGSAAASAEVSSSGLESRAVGSRQGLELPEPGPLSAALATFALALFFFIRRRG